MGDGADPVRAAGDHLGARPPLPVVGDHPSPLAMPTPGSPPAFTLQLLGGYMRPSATSPVTQ